MKEERRSPGEGSVSAAIVINGDDLRLRFPRGDFTDTHIRGLVASKLGSTAGDVQIRPWSEARIGRWYIDKDRYNRMGRHVAHVIRWFGRSPGGHGLVQRVAAWRRVPLFDPPKAPVMIERCAIDGRGWLAPEGVCGDA